MKYILIVILLMVGSAAAQTHIVTNNINGTCYANSGLSQALACAGTTGTIVFTNSYPATMTANVIIPTGVTTRFEGGSCITTTGFTLTINGPLVAPPAQLFCGTGTVSLGSMVSNASVEWFGAVGDGVTDSTTAINNCVSSITAGVCSFQEKPYLISGVISLSKPGTGLQGVCSYITSTTLYSTPSNCTTITTSNPNTDMVDIIGPGTGNNFIYQQIKNITFNRSAVPSSTSNGIDLFNTYGLMIDNVMVQDSANCFYIHGSGSQGTGYIQNSACTWGYNGIAETTGNLVGFNVDSTVGGFNNSLRIRDSFVANNLGKGSVWGGTTTALKANGSGLHDLHVRHLEAATVDTGINLNCVSCSTAFSSIDIFIDDVVLDGIWGSALVTTGILGGVEVNGGWFNSQTSAVPIVDIESSTGVSIINSQIVETGAGTASNYGIYINGSTGTNVISPILGNTKNSAIGVNASTGTNIVGIQASCTGCTSVVNIASGTNVSFGGGQINGAATNGISIDASSVGVVGLDTVGISGPTNLLVDNNKNAPALNGIAIAHATAGTLLCSPTAPTITSGFNTSGGSVSTSNGTCAFAVTVGTGTGTSTGVVGLPTASHGWNCTAPFNITHPGAIIMETANSTTSATFTNYGTSPGAAVNWTNSDVIGMSCFAD